MKDWEDARENGDVLRAYDLLQQHIDGCQDVADLVPLLATAAKMQLEDLGDPYAAMEIYERVLDLDPSHPSSIGALEDIYASVEDWPRLIELLERQDELATAPSDRVQVQLRIATLAEECVDDRPRACRALEQVLALDPHNEMARAGLDRLRN